MKINIDYVREIKSGKMGEAAGYIIKPVHTLKSNTTSSSPSNGSVKLVSAYLFFPENVHNYTYDDYLKDYHEILKSKGHLFSEEIVISLSFLFLFFQKKALTLAEAWRNFHLQYFTTCRLHMEFPAKVVVDGKDYPQKLKDYIVGIFDFEKLSDKIKNNTISDFYKNLEKEFGMKSDQNYLSFKRTEAKISILNLYQLQVKGIIPKDNFQGLIDLYMNSLSMAWTEKFWKEFEEQQKIAVAFGGAYYDSSYYKGLSAGMATQVCLFSHIDEKQKNGWVVPVVSNTHTLYYDSKNPVQILNPKVQSYFDILKSGNSTFLPMIKILVELISNGNRLLFKNEINEAFLNFWIALDTVLNESDDKKAETNRLKNRVAVLTFYQAGLSLGRQYFILKELYDLRSSLVHQGVSVQRESALIIESLISDVLEILLIMHQRALKDENITFARWLNDLDNLVEAGRDKTQQSNLKQYLDEIGVS